MSVTTTAQHGLEARDEMVTQAERGAPQFAGSDDDQRLAEQMVALMRAHGRFMSADAPIRVSVASIASYLSREQPSLTPDRIRAVAELNPTAFAVDVVNEEPILISTRGGQVPGIPGDGARHSFVKRFLTPLPKPDAPAQPVRERARVDPSWATLPATLAAFDDEELEADEQPIDVAIAATGAVEVAAAEAGVAEVAVAPEVAVEPVAAEVEPEPEPEQPEAPLARTITVPAVSTTDVAGVDDRDLAMAIRDRLRADVRLANFGEQWMAEDRVPRFSRGDLRRMKEYIQEQEQPLTDDVLVQDVLSVRPNSPDFDLMRFAVNFRLSREHREFDFVGTANQRFWSTSGLPQIGTTRRKPNEIGNDYRFLLEELPEAPQYRSVNSVDHVLTFYEYHHGLLPYDADLQRLLPAPMLPDQRSAVLTFETPQSYTTYLVDLRYPTPNRGGFILGLDDFYTENLVPGALLSLTRTENDGHYIAEYLAAGNQSARLLELDERRAQRYVFRPTTYGCAVADEMLMTEERFPRLASEKPLDEKSRRRPESVVSLTFERIGDQTDSPGLSATFDDLLAAVNIERPFTANSLRAVLENDETGAFARDSDKTDAYTYVPGSTS